MKCLLAFFLSLSICFAESSTQTAAPETSAQSDGVTAVKAKLPYGVDDVLKLSRAQVKDDVIIKYIQNTGTIYNLSPETIVELKNQGVSDKVLTAMLDQPKTVAATTSIWTQQAPVQSQPQQQVAPIYTQPPQSAPVPAPVPPSTVHVIPYYTATYAYPGGYDYCWPGFYGAYSYGPRWYGPSISLGFGFRFGGGHHSHFRGR